jgi:hypothetical protein
VTAPIADLIGIELVAGPDTPTEDQQHAGKILLLPPEYLTKLGSGPTNPGVLLGIRGYHQTGGSTGHQWVMAGEITQAVRNQILAIPADGWADTSLTTGTPLRVYVNQIRRLAGDPLNVSLPDVVDVANRLHDAAVANYQAQHP